MKNVVYQLKGFYLSIDTNRYLPDINYIDIKLKGVDKLGDKQYPFLLSIIEGKKFKAFLYRALCARKEQNSYEKWLEVCREKVFRYSNEYKKQQKDKEDEKTRYKNLYELPYPHKKTTAIILNNGKYLVYGEHDYTPLNYLNSKWFVTTNLKDTFGTFSKIENGFYIDKDKPETAQEVLKLLEGATFKDVSSEEDFLKIKDRFVEVLKNIAGWESKKIKISLE